MTIREISRRINDIGSEKKFAFSRIQYYRAQKNKKRPHTYNPFGEASIFEDDEYAYHTGGRHEFQFNIGRDWLENKKIEIFRYGIAFSLEKGRSLLSPITEFKIKIERFNKFLKKKESFFDALKMWYYEDHQKFQLSSVSNITDTMIKEGNFIFIGKYFRKNKTQITNSDVEEILSLFDYLLPLYQFVEPVPVAKVVQNKIARLCWNNNGWIAPSGQDGKTTSKSHERDYGYGHEEWLFDFDKTIDGYHYGFVEPVNKFISNYVGKKYNFLLYSINSNDQNKYWIGQLENVEVIDTLTSLRVINTYRNNGWINEIKSQLDRLKLNSNSLDKWIEDGKLFNIRFKPSDLIKYFGTSKLVDQSDNRITSTRYNLLQVEQFDLTDEEVQEEFDINTGNDGDMPYSSRTVKRTFHKEIELEQKHNEMSDKFLKFLKDLYPNEIVKRECRAYGAKRIDMVRKTNQGNIFYEIKTYNDPVTSIRSALGQIFEYAFYPDKRKAIKLIIVSHRPVSANLKKYIQHLNEIIDTPLSYIHYDAENNVIVSQI